MKTTPLPLLLSLLAIAKAAPPDAPGSLPVFTPSKAGWLNETLRADDPAWKRWNLGAFYWSRYEIKENGGFTAVGSVADFRTDVDNDNSYLLQRLILRGGYTGDHFEIFTQARHSSATGDDRSSSGNGVLRVDTNGVVSASGPLGSGSSPESDGPIDLHQAWLRLGNPSESPLTLQVGRQEIILGEHRIVGPLPWNNIQRQWDAVRLRWEKPSFALDAWSSMLVLPRDNAFNAPNPDELFSGLRLTTPAIPRLWSEFYLLSRNVGRDANAGDNAFIPAPFRPPEAQDIYTAGIYVRNSTNDWRNLDFGAQLYVQAGNFADFRELGGAGPRREHRAWATILALGHTWRESAFKPRLGVEYTHASGDNDPNDTDHNTFVHLYPTGHLFYGWADFVSLQNLHNLRLQSSARITPRLKVQLEGHLNWLATTRDNFYNVAGLPRGGMNLQPATELGTGYGIHPEAGSFVGSELDLALTWNVTRHITVETAWCHFFTGAYIQDSLRRSGSQDADYVYVQTQWNF